MLFVPRLEPPKAGNPYYNTQKKGGYNPCITGNIPRGATPEYKRSGYPGLSALPNCTGYATGRFAEILGEPQCQYLGNWMAYYMIIVARIQGLQVVNHPVLGGVMCWKGGPTGAGHLACVEKICKDGSVLTSESEWNGKYWITYNRSLGTDKQWRRGCYWMDKSYTFLGCIVNPAIGEDGMTQEDFNQAMDVWLAEQRNKPAGKYAEDALAWAKETGIMQGDATGNQMPKSFLMREELAVILQRCAYKLGLIKG